MWGGFLYSPNIFSYFGYVFVRFLSHVKHDIYFILPNEWIEGLLYNPKCYLMISQIIEQYIIPYCNMFIVLSICVQVTVLCSKL